MARMVPSPLVLRALRAQLFPELFRRTTYPSRCGVSSLRFSSASWQRRREPPRTRRMATALCPLASSDSVPDVAIASTALAHAGRRAGAGLTGKRRLSTTPTPVTAVGATRQVPERLRLLYKELEALGSDGAGYIDASLLKLVLRSLEVEEPTVRVGVLSAEGLAGPRRLIRACLATAIGPEEEWERALLAMPENKKAMLIRYGEFFEVDEQNPLLQTWSIPSKFLHKNKLEIFISELEAALTNQNPQETDIRSFLVPHLAMPISGDGRISPIAFPVHKAIVYGSGLEGFRKVTNLVLTLDQKKLENNIDKLVSGVVDLDLGMDRIDHEIPVSLRAVNLRLAEKALTNARKNTADAPTYEVELASSRIDALQSFFERAPGPSSSFLVDPLPELIATVLESTVAALNVPSNTSDSTPITSTFVSNPSLQETVTLWSESAHTELRDALATAFHSRDWRRLAWWKLLWRIDDIGLILTELVQRAYLPRSEQGLIFLSGCLSQAGYISVVPEEIKRRNELQQKLNLQQSSSLGLSPGSVISTTEHPTNTSKFQARFRVPTQSELVAMTFASKTSATNGDDGDDAAVPAKGIQPWPTHISDSRAQILGTIPGLQSAAQALLLRSLLTTAVSAAVAALAYVGVSNTTAFEAGAVASFGTVLASGSLQRGWEAQKREWVESVRREGRAALVEAEGWARGIVEDGAKRERDGSEKRMKEEELERRAVGKRVEVSRRLVDDLRYGGAEGEKTVNVAELDGPVEASEEKR